MSNVTPIGRQGVTPQLLVNELLASLRDGDEVFFVRLTQSGDSTFGVAGSPNGLRVALVEFQRLGMAILNGNQPILGTPNGAP